MATTDATSEAVQRERFEALYEQCHRQVFAYAFRRTTTDRARDVVSETFLVAWRRLDDVPEEALPWLLAVARRVLANQRRSDMRKAALERKAAEHASWHRPASDDPGQRISERAATLAALDRIPESDREAIQLIAWDGLDPQAAAEALGCTTATFNVRLHRARKRLAGALQYIDRSNQSLVEMGIVQPGGEKNRDVSRPGPARSGPKRNAPPG